MHNADFTIKNAKKISPQTFKNFLHELYLSTNKYWAFEEINNVFNSPPFNFGEISFASDKEQLEIMVKNGNIRLPIKHIGSSVLQTLYIIASIVNSSSRII